MKNVWNMCKYVWKLACIPWYTPWDPGGVVSPKRREYPRGADCSVAKVDGMAQLDLLDVWEIPSIFIYSKYQDYGFKSINSFLQFTLY